jgi:hypothetical protein
MTLGSFGHFSSPEIDRESDLLREIDRLRDFARNVAGLDDRQLQNTAILKQWRDDARRLLGLGP